MTNSIKAKAIRAVAVAKAVAPSAKDGFKTGVAWGGVRLAVTAVVVVAVSGVTMVGCVLFGEKAA